MLANIQVVLVPLVAWVVLAERPRRAILAALPVAGLGVLLISGVLEHGAYGRNPTRGTLFGLGAGVAYVGFLLLLRSGGSDLRRPAGPLLDATATAAVLCIARRRWSIGDAHLAPSWPSAGLAGRPRAHLAGDRLAADHLLAAPAAGGDHLAAAVVQPVGSMALGALIFGEAPTVIQLAGVGLVLGALLAVGRVPHVAQAIAAEPT